MTEPRKRGRPRTCQYTRLGMVLTEFMDLCAELHKKRRILEAIIPSKVSSLQQYARGRAHDLIESRGSGNTWEDEHGEKHEAIKTVYHGTGIQCSTCNATYHDPEFTVEEEKLYPKLRVGRIIWRLPCQHRMDWLLPTTKTYQQIQTDKMRAAMGWNLDKSCESSGVPTVRTVAAYAKGLTHEDWMNISMLREIDQRKRDFVELSIAGENKGLWSGRKKKN